MSEAYRREPRHPRELTMERVSTQRNDTLPSAGQQDSRRVELL